MAYQPMRTAQETIQPRAGNANPLLRLRESAQSVWLDYLGRDMLRSGALEQLIQHDGLAGVTSNPTIFGKALSHWDDYERGARAFAAATTAPRHLFYDLALSDVRRAADLLRATYERTEGRDGFVSFQLEPRLAHDAHGQVAEAQRIFERLGRPNLMIKVYGTDAGFEALEQLIAAGVNVNVTLLFSVKTYERVAHAYIAGLERRLHPRLPLDTVTSVASFFVSRVDTAIDGMLREASSLRGRAAVANAALAYERFGSLFAGEQWERLASVGARVQRPLWASTGTKNESYSDVKYVEELLASQTVNTMPLATLQAFRDHGHTDRSVITQDFEGARAAIDALAKYGIDIEDVASRLLDEGIESFARDFNDVLRTLSTHLTKAA